MRHSLLAELKLEAGICVGQILNSVITSTCQAPSRVAPKYKCSEIEAGHHTLSAKSYRIEKELQFSSGFAQAL